MPTTTLWAFLSQAVHAGPLRTCTAAVSRVIMLCTDLGRRAPSPIRETIAGSAPSCPTTTMNRNEGSAPIADTTVPAGLPVPAKSTGFFCPASKNSDLQELKLRSPDLFERSVELEDRYCQGKNFRGEASSTRGLGRRFAWRDWSLSALAP